MLDAAFKIKLTIVAIFVAALSWFYLDYRNTKHELEISKKDVVVLKQANEQNIEVQKDLKESIKSTYDVLQTNTAKTNELTQAIGSLSKQNKINISDIEKKYNTLPATDENKVAKEKEISSAVVDNLWSTFCVVSNCPMEQIK